MPKYGVNKWGCALDKLQLLIMELERCNQTSTVKYYDNQVSVHFVLPGHGLLTVEQAVPITNHFRDFAPNEGKYKAVQIFSMWEDKN